MSACLLFWKNGVMTALPTLGGTNGGASQINARGQIVGVAEITTLRLNLQQSSLQFRAGPLGKWCNSSAPDLRR